ncbi:MAG: DUF2207 domain-containing protein, partial [Candidatus Micrarchaeota archaeon]|nr:DUF2207 domain-containing protein [Candidatus Micrarchaeota archaeon]
MAAANRSNAVHSCAAPSGGRHGGIRIHLLPSPALISAEALWLSKHKYIKLEEREVEADFILFKNKSKQWFITNMKKLDDCHGLEAHQMKLMAFFWAASTNNELKISDISNSRNSLLFRQTYTEFFSEVSKSFYRRFMDKKGNDIMLGVSVGGAVIAGLAVFVANIGTGCISAILLLVLVAIVVSQPQILGKWTPEGRLEEKKWAAFKKYMLDFGRLQEKTVPDLILWEDYLIYATAFGIASQVIKTLKVRYPDQQMKNAAFIGGY